MALGLVSGTLELHPYSEDWPRLFAEAKAQIEAVIGDYVLDIQHVGSTSVPGLMAKPILDIGIAVENFEEARRCVQPMEELGYTYRGENGIPRRHYFNLTDAEDRRISLHHVHMNEVTSHDWRAQIAFRDALRQDDQLRDGYAELKTNLVKSHDGARLVYTDSKTGFVTKVLIQELPSLLPRVGSEITVRSFKADAQCYRHWQSTVEKASAEEIVVFSKPGKPVWDIKGEWVSQNNIRTFYWVDKPYNLLEISNPAGELLEIYVNIGSPARLVHGEIHFNDYELDVVRFPGQKAQIVDQDEFAEAAERFRYTDAFQVFCYQAAEEAVGLANSWRVG